MHETCPEVDCQKQRVLSEAVLTSNYLGPNHSFIFYVLLGPVLLVVQGSATGGTSTSPAIRGSSHVHKRQKIMGAVLAVG